MNVIEENWKFDSIILSDIEKNNFRDFELLINEHSNEVLKLLEDSFLQSISCQLSTTQSYNDGHKQLHDKNKNLRHEIDFKSQEVLRLQSMCENYKQDQKLLSQEVKETHEAFLMAKKYYKTFLKIYYSIELRTDDKQVIFLQFYTENKKDSEIYSVRLERDNKSKQYELISTTPKLEILKDFQKILLETNDVAGALYSIREEFLALKKAKK